MAKVNYCKDPDEETRRLLFGDKLTKVNLSELSKRTRIPESTLRLYRKDPAKLTVSRFRQIAKARGLADNEILTAVKGSR